MAVAIEVEADHLGLRRRTSPVSMQPSLRCARWLI